MYCIAFKGKPLNSGKLSSMVNDHRVPFHETNYYFSKTKRGAIDLFIDDWKGYWPEWKKFYGLTVIKMVPA